MAAINACFFALLKSGDHVVVHLSCYGETSVTCRNFEKFGVSHSIIHGNRLEDWIQAIKKGETRIVCIESPSNPMMTVTDIRQLSSEIKALDHEIMIIVDNSLMTSYLQQPLKLGADIVVHSLTKYMNGHNDAMMGAVCTSNKVAHDAIRMVQHSAGGVPSPFDCYLVNRGLKTLSLRMEKHSANALAIAEWLQHHDKVVKVFYPGLKSHPGHEVAVRQSPKGCSGTLSFYIKSTGPETAVRFLKSLHIFKIAGTFGGVNSLSDLPIRSSASQHTPEALTRLGIDHNLIRLAVGIEDLPDLIADLDQAFHHAV